MNKKKFSNYTKSFNFKKLFIDLGWNNYSNEIPLAVNDEVFKISGLVEKRGFVIVLCPSADNGEIPLHSSRRKIENQFSKLHQEHLIIYENKDKTKQIWQFVIHEKDKPRRVHEIPYNIEQDPEILYQRARGLLFTLDEEENVTLVDVIARFKEGFGKNTEQVTKKFYDEFKRHHTSFLDFIEGIDDAIKIQDNKNKQWYASLMLSRLMFCYFIQKRGYLDNDLNYLQNKRREVKQKEGKNRFYSFYRDFLLQLFHQGLGQPQKTRRLTVDVGNIPYLDGGLFDVHVLERQFENIKIKDNAFEKIFNFFDKWNWHLDTSVEATGRDINPDVIGYIFEKYVNDRASMGAYYTKEDITDYIGKNTIIPLLFDKVKQEYPKPFKSDGYLWAYLRNSDDTYIYNAVKKGVPDDAKGDCPKNIEELAIPENIVIGLDTQKPELLKRRKEWNTKTPEKYALPTEIWRETIGRWKRYFEIKNKITSGEITEINNFITYNLNIRQFIQDILENSDDPNLIRHFYKTLHSVTILDPTCGSGAFLFAALNILEPLYETCIERMEQFTAEMPRKYKYFHEVLAKVNSEEHPNLRYYIYKTIILNNLYGVDIMHEAVEIAKLRLFLKMVGAVDMNVRKPNFGLEPLPDIDFNIRAGNTLVGFATEKELKNAIQYDERGNKRMDFGGKLGKFKEECQIVATAFKRFQDAQLITDKGEDTHKKAKAELQNRLDALNDKLNGYLASTYDIDKYKIPDKKKFKKRYQEWYSSHQPFHWFAEFYEIINGNGGFDVVIGNPPYLEARQISYQVCNFESNTSNAVHAMCIERSFQILHKNGSLSMIVPLSIVCTQRMVVIQKIIERHGATWYSNYSWRPGKLFDAVNRALTIFVSSYSADFNKYTTGYLKWNAEHRDYLIPTLRYVLYNENRDSFWFPKLSCSIETNILVKILSKRCIINNYQGKTKAKVYYRTTGGLYWKVFTNFAPRFSLNGKSGSSSRETSFSVNGKYTDIQIVALLSSNVFWWWYTVTANLRDLNPSDISGLKFGAELIENNMLLDIGTRYCVDIKSNSIMLQREQKDKGTTLTQSFKISKSKQIIDEIDKILARHYGFTEEELDYIINYDIKYRMGKALFGEEETEARR